LWDLENSHDPPPERNNGRQAEKIATYDFPFPNPFELPPNPDKPETKKGSRFTGSSACYLPAPSEVWQAGAILSMPPAHYCTFCFTFFILILTFLVTLR
jgi:hypothetical protein